ncbi:MAG: hypothetical protein A2Z08_11760 [Deltaproteobacteria bacterium RBG_16_54_11]|nr:MAG: hypothetical protein A2Z08_11760 [Deltaproteobacteria bacterium RBG_16_54_11]
MSNGTFWKMIVDFVTPVSPSIQGMRPFDPLISIGILGLLAYLLIKGQRRYELLRIEIEALVRRYMIFRGKRYGTLGKIQARKGANKKVLKTISRSWNRFKEYHVSKRELLEKNYRWMKRGFILGCILLALNTLREGIAGLLLSELPSGFFIGLFHYMPHYLLVVVGIALLHIQKEEVYGTPAHQMDPTLEAVFADFDREDSRLSEEFDPLEGEEKEDEAL